MYTDRRGPDHPLCGSSVQSVCPDVRIIDVSSSRTLTMHDVLLNARRTTRQPPGDKRVARPASRSQSVRRQRRKRRRKQVSGDIGQRALISASKLRLLWRRVTSAAATVRHGGAWKLHLMVPHYTEQSRDWHFALDADTTAELPK